jgi:hypothetical protein
MDASADNRRIACTQPSHAICTSMGTWHRLVIHAHDAGLTLYHNGACVGQGVSAQMHFPALTLTIVRGAQAIIVSAQGVSDA